MNGLPAFKIEPPVKWLKHIEKFDTSVFPDCHTIEREWHIRKGIHSERVTSYVHHAPGCKWSTLALYVKNGRLTSQELLE